MQPNTSDKFTEQVLRQVASDARRALLRGHYCIERSKIERFSCIDDQAESSTQFGRQLWYFEGVGVDEMDRRVLIYGAIEYSLQYGLHEMVEDGVFEVAQQRDRFQHVYRGHSHRPSWRDPAHRWLLLGVAITTGLVSLYVAYRLMGGQNPFEPTA